MNNETMIRGLIKCSILRAIQETVAALVILFAVGALLLGTEVGSPRYYGCLVTLVATGFITGVVWSFALNYQMLRTHAATDTAFWREAFHAQARLLRLVPLWYCAPLLAGCLLFVAPTASWEFLPFLMVAAFFAFVFAVITWINRRAATKLEKLALQLV